MKKFGTRCIIDNGVISQAGEFQVSSQVDGLGAREENRESRSTGEDSEFCRRITVEFTKFQKRRVAFPRANQTRVINNWISE